MNVLTRLRSWPERMRLYCGIIPREQRKLAGDLDEAIAHIEKLEAIAHAAWHAMDDSEDTDADGDALIMHSDYQDLLNALEALTGEDGDIHDFIAKRADG